MSAAMFAAAWLGVPLGRALGARAARWHLGVGEGPLSSAARRGAWSVSSEALGALVLWSASWGRE